MRRENPKLNSLKNFRITKNPFLLFAPFLLLYIIFILALYNKTLWGDEIRHFAYAQNLLHGFYSPPSPDVSLEVGPGYPIFISLFIVLHIPPICINLMNAVFFYLAIVFLFKVLREILSFKMALVLSLFFACNSNSLEFMALQYSESLTVFLISLMIFLLTKAFNSNPSTKKNKYIIVAGFIMGYLALTKIIFGYVLLCMLICYGFLWIINRKSLNYRRSIFILLIALVTTAPYLVYTYSITGKIFYWGTSGGNNLYWMSSPYPEEYGNWMPIPQPQADSSDVTDRAHYTDGGRLNIKNRSSFIQGTDDSIRLHHLKDFAEINKYQGAEKDEAYRKFVVNNIKAHPRKYLYNCISNIGRILFNYPYSYTIQKPETLLRLPINGIIAACMLFCIIPTIINWRKIIFPIRFVLIFCLLYLGGTVFGSAETRMFTVIVPLLLIWIAYIAQKSLRFKLTFDELPATTDKV